ncbi:MAG: ATP-dependent DNA helicase RecG [Bacteriovoracia bacterium]
MPPRDKSLTTSSRSDTNNPKDIGVQFVKGVGPALGAVFANRELATVRDLLYFFPRAYEDRSRITPVEALQEGMRASIEVTVISTRKIPMRGRKGRGGTMLDVRCADATGTINLKWFHTPHGLDKQFTEGKPILATGLVKKFMGKAEIVHPEISGGVAEASRDVGRIIPVYTELDGIPTRRLRNVLTNAVETFLPALPESLPAKYIQKWGLPSLREAVKFLHFPPTDHPDYSPEKLVAFDTPAHHRLIFEEFFKFEFLVLRKRANVAREHAPAMDPVRLRAHLDHLRSLLPFQLTDGQKKALQDVVGDLTRADPHPAPSNRLVQGDVGCGKTAVALLAASAVLGEGGQAALMAPTEILAEQHLRNAQKLFGGKIRCLFLTGKTTAAERKPILSAMKVGEPALLIGTHALLEDPVAFKNLDLVIIDEQHRFGVDQRRTLREKGVRKDATGTLLHPHMLILSATPIPRTLALTVYGDLEVTSITDMPPGRSPVKTHIVREGWKPRAFERIREELKSGRQAYFIYPLVNESEAEGFTDLKDATSQMELLRSEVFTEFKVGLLHGKMSSEEKADVMEKFKRNELQVLVSTTVVEVGVDVPNATVMAIEHSERFGLSQLHQLRGRVGRGSHQSYCFLFIGKRLGEIGSMRLETLEQTTDGFKIAEADLEIRGPGEFLGTRQSGGLAFKIANLVRDRDWLLRAREEAADLLASDPNLTDPENLRLRDALKHDGFEQS